MGMTCKLAVYDSYADARRASARIAGRSKPYRCGHCNGYHLSSSTPRMRREMRKQVRIQQEACKVERALVAEFKILKRSGRL